VHADRSGRDTLLARALDEKVHRTVDRIYRLLGLIHPWKDVAAARWSGARRASRSATSG